MTDNFQTSRGEMDFIAEPTDLILAFEETQSMIRGKNGRIYYWSRGAERLYGWTREEALGAFSHDLFRTKFPIPLAEIEQILSRNGSWSGELLHRNKNGDEVCIGSYWVLSRHKDGTELVIEVNVNNDISTKMQERDRTISLQQQTIRELSLPVLQIRDKLLILPIIGLVDSQRAKQLTDNLLQAIRANRAKVIVMDVTGVAAVDSKVANHLIQTVAATRLMGAKAIITGLSVDVAQSLVSLGVDLSKITTVGDLQGGLEVAEQILGYKVILIDAPVSQDETTAMAS